MKCVSPARLDCAAAAWDILCERLDCRSFARSLSLLENLMVRQRHGQSLSDYVHSMRQTFDDYKVQTLNARPIISLRSAYRQTS